MAYAILNVGAQSRPRKRVELDGDSITGSQGGLGKGGAFWLGGRRASIRGIWGACAMLLAPSCLHRPACTDPSQKTRLRRDLPISKVPGDLQTDVGVTF